MQNKLMLFRDGYPEMYPTADLGSDGQTLICDSKSPLGFRWVSVIPGEGDFLADGTVPMTANLNMGTVLGVAAHKIINLLDPTSNQDGATKKYVDDHQTTNASLLTSGTLADARFPATLPAISGVNLTALNATNLGSGTVPDARFPGTLPALNGSLLTIDGSVTFKAYIDSVSAGIEVRDARLTTVAGLPAYNYLNGVAGIGATITGTAFGALSVDGVAVVVGDRILVKNETAGNAPYNGLYSVTATGGGAAFYILTRTLDQDVSSEFGGVLTAITAGTKTGTMWLCTTSNPTIGTTAITFTQFAPSVDSGAVTGTLPVANGGTGVTTSTGTGNTVLSTSPTFVTPILGVPQSGTLTSCTGLPVSTGISGLAANIATFLATPSSANLAAALTDKTGTGNNVFATSPTFVTPILGTPTSGNLSNCTNVSLTAGVTGILPVANGGTGSGQATQWVYRTANSANVNNSAVFVDDGVLQFAVAANKDYVAEFVIYCTSNGAANIKTQITGPATPTLVQYTGFKILDTAAQSLFNASTNAYATAFSTSQSWTMNTNLWIVLKVYISNGANAGTVKLQFAQSAATGVNTFINPGSSVQWTQLN